METLEKTLDPKAASLEVTAGEVRRPPIFWRQFGRAQVSSLAATAVDYSTLFSLVELGHLYYPIAVALGAFGGAVTNFLLNRNWSFEATHGKQREQALRYAGVS